MLLFKLTLQLQKADATEYLSLSGASIKIVIGTIRLRS